MTDISILINFHKEGFFAQPAINSAVAAKHYVKDRLPHIKIEIIAVLDSANNSTRDVVYGNQKHIETIQEVGFSDLANSRNFGIKLANGKYVAMLDGDDMFSENWIYSAFLAAESCASPVLFHTEYFIAFGRESFARRQWSSTDPEYDALSLMHGWYFCNNVFGEKSIYVETPFTSYDHKSGFGSEDWHHACETIAKGVHHVSVINTAYFYRMKDDIFNIGGNSHLGLGSKSNLLVRPSSLFTPASIPFRRPPTSMDFLFNKLPSTTDDISNENIELPVEIMQEWSKASHLDPDCFPSQAKLESLRIFKPSQFKRLTNLYRKYYQIATKSNIFVFVEYSNHISVRSAVNRVLNSLPQNGDITVFLMTPADTSHSRFLPDDLRIIDVWGDCTNANLSNEEIVSLLIRLIIQIQPSELFNLWSSFFLKMVYEKHYKAISSLGIQCTTLLINDSKFPLLDKDTRAAFQAVMSSMNDSAAILLSKKSVENEGLVKLNPTYSDLISITPLENERSNTNFRDSTEVNITCLLNVHNEDYLLVPTLRSIDRMIRFLHKNTNQIAELIVVADNPTCKTLEIVEQFTSEASFKASYIVVNNKNLGLSRNSGVTHACGEWIAFLDGDDLYSENWISEALKFTNTLQDSSRCVLHAQCNVYFGNGKRYFEHVNIHPGSAELETMALANFWTSLLITKKDILLKFPIPKIDIQGGFGFEDWSWYLMSCREGISHFSIPKTAHFIRLKKEGSLNSASASATVLAYPSGLFKIESIQNETN